tara:strand:- start:3126 stop:3407 length:282 start_codon:yes stop_codon:yes gene_type:complete
MTELEYSLIILLRRIYNPWKGIAMQKRAIAIRSRVSGLSWFNSPPFQKRLLRPTLSNPVWMRAEVVETDVASTESGTMQALGFVAQLKIALTE